jgi:hypothetical protein
MKIILRILIILCLLAPSLSCKKSIDKVKEDYVLAVLTNGRWFLDNYTENDIDITYTFSEYEFKFYDNGKVDAITTSATISGTWTGDAANLTFTVNFPNPDAKLLSMNHVWQWIKSNIGVVFAENVTPTKKLSIRLKKK